MQIIHTHIPETNHVPRGYIVAAILPLLFMVPLSLVPALALLFFYVSTFRSMCAVPNMAVFCSSLTSWFPAMSLTYFLNDLEMIPVKMTVMNGKGFGRKRSFHDLSAILGHPISLISYSWSFPSDISCFSINTLSAPVISHIRATCPAHSSWCDNTNTFGEEYRLQCSSLCSRLTSPVTSSLLGPNILLRTLLSNILKLCSSVNVRDQVPLPCTPTGKIIFCMF